MKILLVACVSCRFFFVRSNYLEIWTNFTRQASCCVRHLRSLPTLRLLIWQQLAPLSGRPIDLGSSAAHAPNKPHRSHRPPHHSVLSIQTNGHLLKVERLESCLLPALSCFLLSPAHIHSDTKFYQFSFPRMF